ncbi:MAG: DUF4337 domain-containing protein [Alphaproteobacteria bacterium]
MGAHEMHETHELIHEAAHHHNSRRIAILISILAALLAISEMGGKSAQNTSLSSNITASNLWAFYQAKTIRMTVMRTAAESLDASRPESLPPGRVEALDRQIAAWRSTAERYESDPEKGEGRKELSARAREAEAERDRALGAYHLFEYGSAAFQLAIVMASASLVSEVAALAFAAAGLGVVGLLLSLVAWLAPTLVHL